MPQLMDGIDTAYRKILELERAPLFRCGVVTSRGTFIGADADTLRLRDIAWVKPNPSTGFLIPDDNWTWFPAPGDYVPMLPRRDFGDGWVAEPSPFFDLTQNADDLFVTRTPDASTWDGRFQVRYFLPYAPGSALPALYLVEADGLSPAGPEDAFSIGDVVEHDGELWAAGWAYSDTRAIGCASTAEGFIKSNVETVPSSDPPDPFTPTQGDGGFRLYSYEDEAWHRVADQQLVSAMRPALWRYDNELGRWFGYVFNALSSARVWSFSSYSRPFRLVSTALGLFVVAEGYVTGHHPVQNDQAGRPLYIAHPTYLIDSTGWPRLVGHTAAIADTGGGIIAIGPRSSWTGPQITFIDHANGQPTDPDKCLDPLGLAPLLAPHRQQAPVHWRGSFYNVWESLEPDPQLTALVKIAPAASTVVWARRDGVRWTASTFASKIKMASTPALIHLARGGSLDILPNGREPADRTRELIMAANATLAQSTSTEHRSAFLFAGADEGCYSLGFDRAAYPYDEPVYSTLVPGPSGLRPMMVRQLFDTDVDQRLSSYRWELLLWPGRVTVHRIEAEWLWEGSYTEGPSVERVEAEWLWTPELTEGPSVERIELEHVWERSAGPSIETVTLEHADGLAALAPEVDLAELEHSDGSITAAPEVDRAAAGWAANLAGSSPPEVDVAAAEWSNGEGSLSPDVGQARASWSAQLVAGDPPDVDTVTLEHSDGSALAEPEVDQAEALWAANMVEPGRPAVAQLEAEWSDGSSTVAPEVHTARVEWRLAGGDPEEGEKYLIVTDIDGARCCNSIRVTPVAITAAEAAQCRVLVRADREHLAKTKWGSYQVGQLEEDIALDSPGNVVRVVIIGPAALPDDTDFLIDFERS